MTRAPDTETRQRLAARLDERPSRIPRPPRAGSPTDELSRGWAVVLGTAWGVALAVVALVPPASDPAATPPVWASLVSTVFLWGVLATAAGLVLRQRWGVTASLGAAALLGGMGLACFGMGHPLDAGLTSQIVAGGALAGLSGTAAVRS